MIYNLAIELRWDEASKAGTLILRPDLFLTCRENRKYNRLEVATGTEVAMPEDRLTDISLQDTMIELNILLGLAATLRRPDVPDEELQHFDNLSAYMREHGASLVEASQATAVPVT